MIKKTKKMAFIVLGASFFAGCHSNVPANKSGYYYNNIYFGSHLPPAYIRGVSDGCDTAKGQYTKSHWFFHYKKDYTDGWFMGRNKCKKLLKIDKNGDLIL